MRDGIDPNIWRKYFHRWTPFNAEAYKLVLDELAVAAGIEVRFFTRVIDADVDSQARVVKGVITNNIEGYRYIEAKTFIDATGDAVLADLCGVESREAGCDTPGIMPPTLCSLVTGIDPSRYDKKQQHLMLPKAIEDGHFSQPDAHLPGLLDVSDQIKFMNAGHLFNLNALRCRDLSEGVMKGRRLAQEYLAFYRKYVPGCENLEHVTTAALMGVRESRRIVGEYELNIGDYSARRHFPDQIGVYNAAIDIHPYDNSAEEFKRYEEDFLRRGRYHEGESYGIPYRILVPKGWRNLWVAGRCVSTDVYVHGSTRVQPAAAMMGQAVGTAAVQSMQTGQSANELDTGQLVSTLRDQGAYLPQ